MKGAIIASIIILAERILRNVSQSLWETIWEQIFLSVEAAEKKWRDSGMGETKVQWVIDTVLEWIGEKANLNWWQKQIVRLFIKEIASAIVDSLNEQVGKDWINTVEQWQTSLADKVWFIE